VPGAPLTENNNKSPALAVVNQPNTLPPNEVTLTLMVVVLADVVPLKFTYKVDGSAVVLYDPNIHSKQLPP
jgi:hypothetical protein